MSQRYYRLRDLARPDGRYPVAPSTIWRWVARGNFPEPVKLAGGTTAWAVEAVEAWESQRRAAPTNEHQRKAAAASVERRRVGTAGDGSAR